MFWIKNIVIVISYGDIIFKFYTSFFLSNENEIVIVVDKDYRKKGKALDYVKIKKNKN